MRRRMDKLENTKNKLTADAPLRGRGGKHNFPNARTVVTSQEDKALVTKLLNEVLVEYRNPRLQTIGNWHK